MKNLAGGRETWYAGILPMKRTIHTLGSGSRSSEEFIGLLRAANQTREPPARGDETEAD